MMRKCRLLIVVIALIMTMFSSVAIAETEDSTIAKLIVDGARKEIANGTEYNTDMLGKYFGTHYRDGKKYDYNIYPNGDVNPKEGVCTDLVIRALRNGNFDLQKMVHEDVAKNKNSYGIKVPDKYIDHRRVWVLLKYFKRNYKQLSLKTDDSCKSWQSGDIVIWDIGSRDHFHIGIVSDKKSDDSLRPLVIHNMSYIPTVFTGKTNQQDVLDGVRVAGITGAKEVHMICLEALHENAS